MRIYITSDGTWGDANDLIIVSEEQLDDVGLDLLKAMWDGADGDELYNHLTEGSK